MKIVVDAFGGDNAPLEIIKGTVMAVKEYGVEIVLTGNENIIKKCAKDNELSLDNIEIVHTEEVMSMHDQPTDIIRSKKNTSLGLGLSLLAEDKGDAFVSAGSTGAIVAGGSLIVKRIKGVKRAAIGTVIPTKTGNVLLMDCGANVDCRPEMLAQFGLMASVYLNKVLNIENPKIGLLNNGTEDTKGGELQKESYALLKQMPINFIGNVEAREIPNPPCDAIIADGFTGNVAIKLFEGVASTLFGMIKEVLYKNIITKLAALLILPGLKTLKAKFNYKEVGGAMLLGVRKPVIKAHGSSDALAIKNAIRQAKTAVENKIIESISSGL